MKTETKAMKVSVTVLALLFSLNLTAKEVETATDSCMEQNENMLVKLYEGNMFHDLCTQLDLDELDLREEVTESLSALELPEFDGSILIDSISLHVCEGKAPSFVYSFAFIANSGHDYKNACILSVSFIKASSEYLPPWTPSEIGFEKWHYYDDEFVVDGESLINDIYIFSNDEDFNRKEFLKTTSWVDGGV